MVNSAGINFGKPNEEFIIESDGNGALTSARNAVTGTEYVGGGGGDFSTATLKIINSSGNGYTCRIPIVDSVDFDEPCIWVMDSTAPVDDEQIIPLYKGNCWIYIDTNFTVSGNAEVDGNDCRIFGDVTITL